jgi:hypothetical protein
MVISATHSGGMARAEVRDTGIGIVPEEIARALTPFQQTRMDFSAASMALVWVCRLRSALSRGWAAA